MFISMVNVLGLGGLLMNETKLSYWFGSVLVDQIDAVLFKHRFHVVFSCNSILSFGT